MDSETRDVLRCLWWPTEGTKDFKSRPTYWSISKQLQISPKIAKARLEALKTDGILQGIVVRPDVSLFGLRRTGLLLSFGNKVRQEMDDKVRLLDFVECAFITRIFLMQDGRLKVPSAVSSTYVAEVDMIHRPNESLDRKTELLHSLVGDFTVVHTITFEETGVSIASRNALGFLRELVRKPFADMRVLAKASSVNEKTVARYFYELAKARAIIYEPIVDSRRSKETLFHLGLVVEPEKKMTMIKRLKGVLDGRWLGTNQAGNLIGIVCVAKDLGDANDTYFRLTEDEELKDCLIVFGLYTIDNSANVAYMPNF